MTGVAPTVAEVEAAARVIHGRLSSGGVLEFDEVSEAERDEHRLVARLVLMAAREVH